MISYRKPATIALVRPPVIQLTRSLSSYGAILPIGLAYVASVLRDAGHRLQVIDAPGEAIDRFTPLESPIGTLSRNGLTPEEIVDRLLPDTEILGITHMFLHEWPTIRRIAELAKERLPDLVVVLGGENATAYWKWIFQQSAAVDYCVLGEGEATMLDLVDRLRDGVTGSGMTGVACRPGLAGEADGNALSARRTELDDVPRPAWELFPIDAYLHQTDGHGVHRGASMPMLATRGCPYQCTFCSSPSMWTTKYVTRTPADVVDEIKDYVTRFGVRNVNFCDLTAIIKKEWIVEFCQLLKAERLGLTWQLPTGTRTEALDGEVLALLNETGCRNITYAPESGSKRMLQTLKKKVLLPRMLDCLRAARKVGIVTRVNIIIGHPEERGSDTLKSLWFLFRAALTGCQDAAVMIFAPYPGSADFARLLEEGKIEISPDFDYLALARSGFSSRTYNPRMGTRQLILTQYAMLLAFYATAYISRPWRIFSVMKSLFTGQETTQLDQLLRTKARQISRGRKRDDRVEVAAPRVAQAVGAASGPSGVPARATADTSAATRVESKSTPA